MSDSDTKGTQEQASSEGSDNGSNQTGRSAAEYVSVAEFNKLQSQIESLRRGLQSDKDKGIKQVSQRLDGMEGDLKAILQSALSKGQNVSDVLSDLRNQEEEEARQAMLEMSRAFREGRFPQAGSGGSEQAQGVDVNAVLTELELDKNDVRVREFQTRQFKSQAELALEAAKLVKSISRQPSDADQAEQVGERRGAGNKQEALMQEYREGSKNLRGIALTKYKQVMRKKGLEIS